MKTLSSQPHVALALFTERFRKEKVGKNLTWKEKEK
jgi:hypothetical protein